MPPVFKAVVTISVWVLFIKGCLAVLTSTLLVLMAQPMATGVTPLGGVAMGGIGVVALVLACVAAWIRQKIG
jgi:uncharacterized membrane protein YqgA involved in biofilm formation